MCTRKSARTAGLFADKDCMTVLAQVWSRHGVTSPCLDQQHEGSGCEVISAPFDPPLLEWGVELAREDGEGVCPQCLGDLTSAPPGALLHGWWYENQPYSFLDLPSVRISAETLSDILREIDRVEGRHQYIDADGRHCILGALALAAGVPRYELLAPRSIDRPEMRQVADAIYKKFGLTLPVLVILQETNDLYRDAVQRREALAQVVRALCQVSGQSVV